MKFPRYERIAAGVVSATYVAIIAWTWWQGDTPCDFARDTVRDVVELVDLAMRRQLDLSIHSTHWLAFGALLTGLVTFNGIFAIQAILRARGFRGFLGGRSTWWWIGSHAIAAFTLWADRVGALGAIWGWGWAMSTYLLAVFASAYVLWRGRKRALPQAP